ncbi:MAG: type III-B CRISPR module RAMP protein Cmr4 [Nitrospirota bacterium]
MCQPFQSAKYMATALDPIHIGTGGYNIGRVDNSVIRDFDDVPKIPGTSIAGAVRSYAAMQFPEKRKCAGKDDSGAGGRQCGEQDCPICVTFGFTRDTESRVSMVTFSDARILFFPVSTMIGPVWVTSPSRLKEFTGSIQCDHSDGEKIKVVSDLALPNGKLNLGWVLLQQDTSSNLDLSDGKFSILPDPVKKNAVCVTDRLFPLIVNSNLEVRTSVSINPFTGAALEGALFTYEGIPRTTIFWFEAVYQDYKNFNGNHTGYIGKVREKFSSISDDNAIEAAKSVTEAGADYCKILGLGGMSTRGFGRLEIEEVQ